LSKATTEWATTREARLLRGLATAAVLLVISLLSGCQMLSELHMRWFREYSGGDYEGGCAVGVAPDSSIFTLVFALREPDESQRYYRLLKYSPDGDVIWKKSDPLDFFSYDMTGLVDHAGAPVMVESYTNRSRIVKFDASGNRSWSSQDLPFLACDIACDGSNNLLIVGVHADSLSEGSDVVKLDSSGMEIWHALIDSASMGNIALRPDGEAVVAGENRAAILGTDGAVVATFAVPPCNDLAVSAEGRIAVSTWRGTIFRLQPDGTPIDSVPLPEASQSYRHILEFLPNGELVYVRSIAGPVRYHNSALVEVTVIDANGRERWSEVFGSWFELTVHDASLSPDGTVVVTGWDANGAFTMKVELP